MKKKEEEGKEEEKKDQQNEMPNFRGMFEGASLTNCTQNFIWGNEIVHVHSNEKKVSDDKSAENKVLSKENLARAIENCQQYFWGNSAYAVVFCICRDVYKIIPNKTAFEEKVEELPYTKKRDHTCPKGTIANAFSDNPIFNEDVTDWDNFNPAKRIIKLRDELFRELKL